MTISAERLDQIAHRFAELEARQLSLDIALIRTLGGGYQAQNSTGDR